MRRPWALPLVPLYWLGLRVSNAVTNARSPKRLACPVLSVGSLSAGGAGKTPVVMALADLLQRNGHTVDVLSRGYGRGSGAVEQVDPTGPANRFGDEPLELAQSGLQVFVGADRHAAGILAEATHPNLTTHIHLLDDGFQHRRLLRNVNVVLLTQADAQDHLLPAGNLREPLAALRRADLILLRDEEAAALEPLARTHTQAPIHILRRTLELPPDHPPRLLAFCGVARPEAFFSNLRQQSLDLAGTITFPDHHPYRPEDIARLVAAAHDRHAQGIVTTAKDAVKLTPAHRAQLAQAGPLIIARLHVTFADEEHLAQQLRAHLA